MHAVNLGAKMNILCAKILQYSGYSNICNYAFYKMSYKFCIKWINASGIL